MKHRLCYMLAGTAVFISNTVAAQFPAGNAKGSRYKTAQRSSASYMPTFSFDSRHSLNNIDLRAVRDLLKRYEGEAREVSWQITGRGDYIARFSADPVDVIAAYGKQGNWLYSVKRYPESKLPDNIKTIIKKAYPDYLIAHGDEVSLPFEKNSTYIVSIQDDAEIKILAVCGGNLEVRQNFLR